MSEMQDKFGTTTLSLELFRERNRTLARALECENHLNLGSMQLRIIFLTHHYEETSMYTIFHTHSHYEISMMNYGTVEYKTAEKHIKIDTVKNDWLLMPPGLRHQRICTKTPSVIHGYSVEIAFASPSVKRRFDAAVKKAGCIFPGGSEMAESLAQINSELLTDAPLKNERLAILCKDMLLMFFRFNYNTLFGEEQDRTSATNTEIILKVIESYIEENLSGDISLEKLSSFCGFSPRHLNRLFVEACGIPLIRYINRKKMDEAMHELITSHKMIKEIALDLGYTDQSYFNRVFKKHFGKTPEVCRAEHHP